MDNSTSTSTRETGLPPMMRWLFLAVVPGIIAGIIVGGIGSRIVMRIVGAMEGSLPHQETDFGFTVGSVTGFGMVFLIIFAGSASGFVGGLAYMCVRPWLGAKQRWRGLYFGAILLLAGGGLVIEGGNTDFVRFGSSTLNIFMFAVLFIVFGLLVAPLVEWADIRFQPEPNGGPPGKAGQLALLGIFLVASVPLVLISLLVFTGVVSDPVKVMIPALLLMLIPLGYLTRPSRPQNESNRRPRIFLAGYGVIAAASLVGLVFGLQAIVEIRDCAEILSVSGLESVGITDDTARFLCSDNV